MNASGPPGGTRSASTAVSIRDAEVEDAPAIESVHYASREAAYEGRVKQWPPEGLDRAGRVARWRQWLLDPSIHCLVAEQAGEIVGFSTVRPVTDDDLRGEPVAEMPTLYVRPDCWHLGLGQALCAAAMDRAAGEGFEDLVLWVLEVNERARAFYEEFGFVPDGARKVDEGTVEGLMADRFRMGLRGPE